jgi:replicative DNA helicase
MAQIEGITERVLPANIKAEQMLLGAILINPSLIEQVNEFLRIEHFFEIFHQKIYNSIEIISEKGLTPSIITLKSMLEKDPLFSELNGEEYLVKLTIMAMVVINPQDYGKIIFDLAIKRNLIQIGEETVNIAYDSTLELSGSEQLETAETKLYKLASEGINEKSFLHIKEHVALSLDSINRAMKNSDHVTGISTGISDLDKKLSGFHNSDLVIIAGRPGMGKTAFAINFAFNACKSLLKKTDLDKPKPSVGFFSLEMSSEQLSTRLLSMLTKIDSTLLRSGKVNEEHYNDLRRAAADLAEMQIFIDDTPALTISAVRTRARKLKRKHNLGIIFIDYLQLLRGSNKSENRVVEVSEITQGLKALAKELNIPVIALAQLSRAVEQREDKKPMLSDLRESGSIEQDADIVMFLYREEYYLRRQEPKHDDPKYSEWADKLGKVHNLAEILVAKHRNGAVGNVAVYYEDKYSTIGNLERIH